MYLVLPAFLEYISVLMEQRDLFMILGRLLRVRGYLMLLLSPPSTSCTGDISLFLAFLNVLSVVHCLAAVFQKATIAMPGGSILKKKSHHYYVWRQYSNKATIVMYGASIPRSHHCYVWRQDSNKATIAVSGCGSIPENHYCCVFRQYSKKSHHCCV